MFTRSGFRSLSDLWSEFANKFGETVQARAVEAIRAETFRSHDLFGTACDLCEDVFLRTFEDTEIALVPMEGEVVFVQPALMGSNAQLFAKLTPFESFQVLIDLDENDPEEGWVRSMGSSRFKATTFKLALPGAFERAEISDLESDVLSPYFHTLPVLFERPSYVIARALPPWVGDLVEDSYARSLNKATFGSSICVSEKNAAEWQSQLSNHAVQRLLEEMLPSVRFEPLPSGSKRGGRPRKVDEVASAYRELGLSAEHLTWKEIHNRLEAHLGFAFSEMTLRRVVPRLHKQFPDEEA
ncbi:hypothetical protein [Maritimibacter sp. UBA3975]|uniref:hypothetical protein n=1 Tax=Maritimibacter sp. UBA3975 TaxID=1946833 RepID=UPI000C0AB1EE|nr:hypothetical protein [Maritimibacter sp. UBA3975]MAM60642.1 hypothetical protein [Maritimibacter sp.]